jgi:ubiquinone biosynthesis protein
MGGVSTSLSTNGHTPTGGGEREHLAAFLAIKPEPIELPRAHLARSLARGAHASAVALRFFAPAAGRRAMMRDARAAHQARRMFEALGATYMKFGQFVASAPGLVGERVAAEFRTCLDTGPAVPFPEVRRTVEAELGRPLAAAFARFEERPAAAASMAVVHKAWLHDDTAVAVKVLRPGIERVVATDLAMMERGARFMAARGIEQGYNMVSLVVGLRAQVAEELNLRNEARAMEVFRRLFEEFGLSLLVVPRVHGDHSARRVLTMDWLEGAPIDDLAHARSVGADLTPIVRELLKAWVLTAIRVGAFHADIHPGNLLLLRDGRLGMIDWGIVSRMEGEAYAMFRALCEASVGREEAWDEMGDVMLRINGPGLRALGLTDDEIRGFVRATFEPVLTKPLSEVSMAELMMSGDDVIRKARGTTPPKRNLRERLRAMRAGGKAYREAAANRAFEDPTMHMSFLSMKQLLYLERYARAYMPDESLLGDGAFVREVLGV